MIKGNPIGKIVKTIRRRVKNFSARNSGHGSCPNCGDNWLWKPAGGIPFKTMPALRTVTIPSLDFKEVGIVKAPTSIMICAECLSNPAGLDPVKIKENLMKSGWSPADITLAEKAIMEYKAQKKNN